MAKVRQILVTSALPYANGSIHIGHLVEYIQTDIWVRFQRLRGHQVTYVCGDDAHGTPIMLKARQQGIEPSEFIAQMNKEHQEDFAKFGVEFDHYGSTNAPLNQQLCNAVYERVKAAGMLTRREIEQFYDPESKAFLADRFIKGTCPFCKTPEQYGDGCEVCGKTYSPTELIEPKSVFSGATPVLKKSEHIFLQLEPSRDFLLGLYARGLVDESLVNKLKEWFNEALRDWDISRDERFFGFPIPGETGKYFFNWFDAPIGYLASLGEYLKGDVGEVEEFWNLPEREVYHFIGKDILYFHALFWPAMLHGAKLRVPTKIAVHGHLTVNGKKMAKRDGTFIKASTFARHLDSQYLRYYYATKLGPAPEDLDLSFEDFRARVDGELVNKIVNLVSRGQLLARDPLKNQLGVSAMDAIPLLKAIRGAADEIAAAYEGRDFALATRIICGLADQANKYVEDNAPWKIISRDPETARGVLTASLEAGRILTIYVKPILPEYAAKVEKFLAIRPLEWEHVQDAMEPHAINPFEHMVKRLDAKAVDAMIEESKEGNPNTEIRNPNVAEAATGAPAAPVAAEAGEPLAATINIDQFAAVDLRVARVLNAEPLEKSDKLMKLTLDAGPIGKRTILAGIKKAYQPEKLVGRLVIFCANLAPRAMGKGGSLGTSEGMICAASPFNGPAHEIFVLSPDEGAKPGQRVH